MKDIRTDLKNYFKTIGLSQGDIARKLGISQAYVSQMLNGTYPFGRSSAQKWQDEFGLSAAWLMTGEGEMLVLKEGEVINNHDSEIHVKDNHGQIGAIGNDATVTMSSDSEGLLKIIEKQQALIASQQAMIDKLLSKQ